MPISRSEGYRRAVGKEEGGLAAVEAFFESQLGVSLQRITEPEENYLRGDLRCRTGRTIECKRQPIDPVRYKENFVEVCEETHNPRHVTGFADLARILAIDEDQLSSVRVSVRGTQVRFGRPAGLSISVRSMFGSSLTVYVNPGPPAHIYVYESAGLIEVIKDAMRSKGMVRGMGKSNVDTFAVLVPPPRERWTAEIGKAWRYSGDGSEHVAVAELQRILTAPDRNDERV